MVYFKDDLYLLALELFQASGYAVTSEVIFSNHSPEQVIYFDSGADIYISKTERNMLKDITNISYLFNIGVDSFDLSKEDSVGFYSIEIVGSKRYRSQIAYDTHCILKPFLSGKGNIILYRLNEEIMLTVQGFDTDVYLSDWFHQSDDFDFLAERIHICNMSLNTAKDFIIDFAYSSARWYYIYPITGEFVYNLVPINYYSIFEPIKFNYREFKKLVQSLLETVVVEYGDDYVTQKKIQNKIQTSTIDIQTELDLLALEIEFEDKQNIFEKDLEGDDYYENNSFEEDIQQSKDEYEFEYIDKEIFDDPVLMVKHLKKLEKMGDNRQKEG